MNVIWWRFFIALCFGFAQNRYFGWNAWPQSDAELIADGIFALLVALSISDERNERGTAR